MTGFLLDLTHLKVIIRQKYGNFQKPHVCTFCHKIQNCGVKSILKATVPEMPLSKEKEGDTGGLIFPPLHKLAQTMIFSQLEETIVFAFSFSTHILC